MIASSNSREKVLTALTSVDKDGKATPVHITSDHLTYTDAERKAHYEGSVNATSEDATLSSDQMDVLFANGASGREGVASRAGSPGGEPPPAAKASLATGAKLEKIIASGSVVITQPDRRATGDKLTYTAEDGKFVLTGGPPAIFDAKQGKVIGNSVTMFRDDDRVIVEGNNAAPAVTETNISRTH